MKRFAEACADYEERLCLLASDVLAESEAAAVQEHLAGCESCRKYYADMAGLVTSLAEWEKGLAGIEPTAAAELRWASAIRAAADTLPARTAKTNLREYWDELIWSYRHAWAGMAALWLVLWLINSGPLVGRSSRINDSAVPAAALMQAIEDQRQVMAEVMPPPAEVSREAVPQDRGKPRSERDRAWKIT
jgi:anti-sigma factor RsiW